MNNGSLFVSRDDNYFVDKIVETDYLEKWAVILIGIGYIPAKGRPFLIQFEFYQN